MSPSQIVLGSLLMSFGSSSLFLLLMFTWIENKNGHHPSPQRVIVIFSLIVIIIGLGVMLIFQGVEAK